MVIKNNTKYAIKFTYIEKDGVYEKTNHIEVTYSSLFENVAHNREYFITYNFGFEAVRDCYIEGVFYSATIDSDNRPYFMIMANSSTEYEVINTDIKEVVIEEVDGNVRVRQDTIINSDKHLFKYVKVSGDSNYIADIIAGKKAIRATNPFGFADRFEANVNYGPACSYSNPILCGECTFQKTKICTREKDCVNCIGAYTGCNRVGKCSIKKTEMDMKACESDLCNYELKSCYILCLSHLYRSVALIEKFCGRCGFILEYEIVNDNNIVEVKYQSRSNYTIGIERSLANSIKSTGYCSPNNKLYTDKILGWKQKEFEYEKEARIIMRNSENIAEDFRYYTEKELGLKLVRVIFVHDKYYHGLNEKIFEVLDMIGQAILERDDVIYEEDTGTDFDNGSNINGVLMNKYYINKANKKNRLSKLGNQIKNRQR